MAKPYDRNPNYQDIDSSKIVQRGITVKGDDQRAFDKAFRQFNKKCQTTGIIKEVRDRQHFVKPSEKRRLAKKAAINKTRRDNAIDSRKPGFK